MGETRPMSTCQFPYSTKKKKLEQKIEWLRHDFHIIWTNAVTLLDSLKKIWVILVLLSQGGFSLGTDKGEGQG